MEIVNIEARTFEALMWKLEIFVEKIMSDCRPLFNGDRYLGDKEVGERLSVGRRTLQEWRNDEIIGYIKIGGKVL